MDIMKMMGQMQETQRKIEQAHQSMNNVILENASSDNLLKVTITANNELKSKNFRWYCIRPQVYA